MSSSERQGVRAAVTGGLAVLAAAFLVAGASRAQADEGAEVCPLREEGPLRYVDVFDGAPADLATLVPDVAEAKSGSWLLGYVYDARRQVTIRCKYRDGAELDVAMPQRISRCDYRIGASDDLDLRCR